MPSDLIPGLLSRVCAEEMRRHLFHLAKDPLPWRTLNRALPGHQQCTLDEADDYLQGNLEAWGYAVEKEGVPVQAFRRDETRPLTSQFSTPEPEDPWYTAYNLYAKKRGGERPEQIIVVISHKDSQSWCESPGANDNAIGTVGNLELARVLADVPTRRSVWFVWCNEEHVPWTSVTAARAAKARGDNIVAVLNVDGIGVARLEDRAAGVKTQVAAFTAPEGEALADLLIEVSEEYVPGLRASKVQRQSPGDDDGSFVNAGYPAAVIVIGSWPYADPNYHQAGDVPERVDVENAALSVQALLAAILRLDAA